LGKTNSKLRKKMIILTHIGINLPTYLEYFLKQLRVFNSDTDIVFLVNENNITHPLFNEYNIKTHPLEGLECDLMYTFIDRFGHGDRNSNKKDVKYASSDYWCVAATRLFYLYKYTKNMGVDEFVHFENDIMLYENISNIVNTIKSNSLYKNSIALTRASNELIMTGFMYVPKVVFLENLLTDITSYLNDKNSLKKYNNGMINEMTLINAYHKRNVKKISNLPTLPYGVMSENYDILNSIFDPATYGQYLDGIPKKPGVSLITDSYIGTELKKDNRNRVIFKEIDGLRVPYLTFKGELVKINSLHIHSKRLNLFSS